MPGHEEGHGHDHDESREWDEVYTEDGDTPRFSGRVNGTLVAEVADLAPGSVLDVGCGEGADATWLAGRGWRVTAVDPSAVALARARSAARDAGVEVTWVHAGLLTMPDGTGVHDLVSAQYPALRHTNDDAIMALLGAVAPVGTLLFVHHDMTSRHAMERAHEHGLDPGDYVAPADVADHLGDEWVVEVDEVRPRPGPLPDDAPHVDDIVLRARRRPTD